MYVNELPQQTTTSSVALFAYDTKRHRAISKPQDVRDIQCDFDRINKWCQVWRMTLNQSKCGVLTVTRNVISVQSSYHLINDDRSSTSLTKRLAVQRDLGVLIIGDFKWIKQVNAVCTKANRMLGFIRRTSADMRDHARMRTALYKTLVRNHFVYS